MLMVSVRSFIDRGSRGHDGPGQHKTRRSPFLRLRNCEWADRECNGDRRKEFMPSNNYAQDDDNPSFELSSSRDWTWLEVEIMLYDKWYLPSTLLDRRRIVLNLTDSCSPSFLSFSLFSGKNKLLPAVWTVRKKDSSHLLGNVLCSWEKYIFESEILLLLLLPGPSD